MRKSALFLTGAAIVAFSAPSAFAQEAVSADPTGAVGVMEDAFGPSGADDAAEMAAIAMLPLPEPAVFAAALQANRGASLDVGLMAAGDGGERVGGGPGHWNNGKGGFFGLQGALALSDDQVLKMYAIKNDSEDTIAPKKLALHQATRGLMDALGANEQDSAVIKKYQGQVASLKSDISMAETNKLIQLSQVLTADQRHAIRMAMIRGHMMGGWAHHGMPPHHP